MTILYWLAAPLAVTAVAMMWALWSARSARGERTSAADYRRFGQAVTRPLPPAARTIVTQRRERPSGVAVRPSATRDSAPR